MTDPSSRRRVPTCVDCGEQHYNFHPCPERQDLKPPVEWRHHQGWGNRMHELKHLGGNSFVQRREFER